MEWKECSAKAITHRIAKIKTDSKASSTGGASIPAAGTTPKRARAPKSTGTPKTPVTASKERARRASVKPKNYAQSDEENDDGSEHDLKGEESPSKKVKMEDVVEGEEADGV